MKALEEAGELPEGTCAKHDKEQGEHPLPERVGKPSKSQKPGWPL